MFENQKKILPEFPRTPHLPYSNVADGDIVANELEIDVIWKNNVNIEEKIDGASCGMCLYEGEPIIRNRDHILRKGYYKKTAAKMQFASVFNWFYDNKDKFKAIGNYSVYGEWCVASHSIAYTLPDYFIAYDIYDYKKSQWLVPPVARKMLIEAGFHVPNLHFQGKLKQDLLSEWAKKSIWSEESEGVYIKVYDKMLTHRFKLVNKEFQRGRLWDAKKITKNKLLKQR